MVLLAVLIVTVPPLWGLVKRGLEPKAGKLYVNVLLLLRVAPPPEEGLDAAKVQVLLAAVCLFASECRLQRQEA